ncbi:DUF4865 family protein [Piscinibacter terrae]|uniref:DUF4865 family protein n=1 Tax=Piscinibacter terrae TaxID=2496871 RepID=A0A3N7HVI5_9BURK|nr:DUF4865 family protein [Albitalea terrae]RQP25366.1 DUF4865 family protein [Albitalea terrae]
MRAMQYVVPLPAAFDMDIIRRRVADKGPLMDDLPGLGFKAWLYAVHGEHGAENRYAPFYLWHEDEAMNSFLLGPGFATLAADFGRPPVRSWTTLHAELTRSLREARVATVESAAVPAGTALDAMADAERVRAQLECAKGALVAVVALDPHAWSLVRLLLWRDVPGAARERETYAVGHVSVGTLLTHRKDHTRFPG